MDIEPFEGGWVCLSNTLVVQAELLGAVFRSADGVRVHVAASSATLEQPVFIESGPQADVVWTQFAGSNPISVGWRLIAPGIAINLARVAIVQATGSGAQIWFDGMSGPLLISPADGANQVFRYFFMAGNKTVLVPAPGAGQTEK